MKLCKRCNSTKDSSCFYKRSMSNDGLSSSCKDCVNSRNKILRSDPNAEREVRKVFSIEPVCEKECSCCGVVKPADMFFKDKSKRTGLCAQCKECSVAAQKEWKRSNREQYNKVSREYAKKWRDENMERSIQNGKNYRQKNIKKVRMQNNARKKINRTYYTFMQGKRRSAKLKRTVLWGNRFLIELQYKMARKMTELLGVEYHVDHIIPLQGALVSGLHVHNNLQVIKASDNFMKGNRYDDC